MIKIYCDLCQEEITADSYATLILDGSKDKDRQISSYALCDNCYLNVEKQLNRYSTPIINT